MATPRLGNNVWVSGFGNGEIRHIDYESREVMVHFWYTGVDEAFEYDSFDSFNERLNQWIINT